MQLESLHNPETIRQLLEVDRGRFAYLLGDLDPFFWARTIWFSAAERNQHRAIVLLYLAHQRPVLLIFGQDEEAMRWLLQEVSPILPSILDVHLEKTMVPTMNQLGWDLQHPLPHYRMILKKDLPAIDIRGYETIWFTPLELEELNQFYKLAYPNNYFDPRMLATGRYVGCRDSQGEISAVAGVHVYSPGDSVAALGNITIHPNLRGQGLGRFVTRTLCTRLQDDGIQTIALNVFHQNLPAIKMYERLGFETQLTFIEALATRKTK